VIKKVREIVSLTGGWHKDIEQLKQQLAEAQAENVNLIKQLESQREIHEKDIGMARNELKNLNEGYDFIANVVQVGVNTISANEAEIAYLIRQRDNFIKEATRERLKLEMLSNITPMMDSKNIINPDDVATIAKDLKGIIEATKKGNRL